MTVLVALLIAVAVSGCRVGVVVDVEAEPDGSGVLAVEVTLDEEAAAEVPDLPTALEVGDLVEAGWEVTDPVATTGGGLVVRAERPFASPADAGVALDDLTGAGGPFADLTLDRTVGLLATTYELHGTVDLRPGLAVFADDELRELLGGAGVGIDAEELERRAGVPVAEAVTVELTADLPGASSSGAPHRFALALGESSTVSAASEVRNVGRLAWAAVAIGAAALSVVIVLRRVALRLLGTAGRRHRRTG